MEKSSNIQLAPFASSLKGKFLSEGSPAYHEARKIWNGMIDRKPVAIVQCMDREDVAKAVGFARENNLILAIKGGGHNVAGNAVCEGGLMIDLSLMRAVTVDVAAKKVKVEGGCLMSDVDFECQKFGLVVPGGIVSHTGVAGLTLGGGFGWTSRKYGFSIDNLLSAEVVTASGRILTASATENPDLFWAIRGGGGNFGVVTSFEFKASKAGPEVYSGVIAHSFENARKYLQFHRKFVRTLPDEMTVWTILKLAPPLPFLPASAHGKLAVLIPFIYLDDAKKGEELIRPIREFAKPIGEHVGMSPFVEWQKMFDVLNAHGARNYWKSHNLPDLPDEFIDKIISFAKTFPSPDCDIVLPHLEGAPSRVPENATAYAFRKPAFNMNVHTRWTDSASDKKCIAWARDLYEQTKPFAQGVYVNFLSDEGEERVRDAYSAEGWKRLVEIKTKYDPDNIFRMNQNIKPLKN